MNFPAACPSRELFEHALECSSRALAGDADLQLSIPAIDMSDDQIAVMRGYCDVVAVKTRFHNVKLHRQMSPAGPLSRGMYDELENLRVEALASRLFSGVAANLAASFEHRYGLRGLDVLASDVATPLANAAVLMVRASLLDRSLPKTAERLVSHWQLDINVLIGDEIRTELDSLASIINDQALFARWSRRFINGLELVDEPEKGQQAKPAEDAGESEKDQDESEQSGSEDSQADSDMQESPGTAPISSADDDQQESVLDGDSDPQPGDSSSVIPFPGLENRDSVASALDSMEGTPQDPDGADRSAGGTSDYHVYTTRFDQLLHARDMVNKDTARHLRAQLDQEISEHRQIAVRLANRLQNSLTTLQKRAWTFDLDDGLLDTTRLSRLVVDPTSPLVYKQERRSETRDTLVSFLIDNSGSMRGRPIALAAMFADILAQALERCHVATEILGFTTREWRGGKTCQNWRTDGKPANPGRLSDLRHVIYKAADEPWRKARQSLGVMLWPDLLRENIDGEALLWAHNRLTGRSEQRRILVVVSDGVPADDATLTNNNSDYLDSHLRQVIDWIEAKSPVELLAIGIGHDVSTIYTRSVTIADSEQLGDAMAHELIELLGNVPSRARYPFAINH